MNNCPGSWLGNFADTKSAPYDSKDGMVWVTASCCAALLPEGSKSS